MLFVFGYFLFLIKNNSYNKGVMRNKQTGMAALFFYPDPVKFGRSTVTVYEKKETSDY